jgi:hypothetical protein
VTSWDHPPLFIIDRQSSTMRGARVVHIGRLVTNLQFFLYTTIVIVLLSKFHICDHTRWLFLISGSSLFNLFRIYPIIVLT